MKTQPNFCADFFFDFLSLQINKLELKTGISVI